MNKEELILDIVEKTYDKVEGLTSDLQDMKIEQTRQNVIVERHEARSTASEARLVILEKDAQFFRNFIIIMSGVGAVITLFIKILPYINR